MAFQEIESQRTWGWIGLGTVYATSRDTYGYGVGLSRHAVKVNCTFRCGKEEGNQTHPGLKRISQQNYGAQGRDHPAADLRHWETIKETTQLQYAERLTETGPSEVPP